MSNQRVAGAAVATPLTANFEIDGSTLVSHCKDLLARGVDRLILFGTTGEGASFTRAERTDAVSQCVASGIEPEQLGVGVFSNTTREAGEDAKVAFENGCGHVLLAPPSYYKGVGDDGLLAWFSQTIEAAGQNPGQFVLYHIPAMTQVELSVELVNRLATNFPGVVTGVKDSSGNWPHTERLINERGELQIFVGHDGQVERGMGVGATGTIAGTANFLPEIIHAIVWDNSEQPNMGLLIDDMLKVPVIAAVKTLIEHRTNNTAWSKLRAPLTALNEQQRAALAMRLDALFPAG